MALHLLPSSDVAEACRQRIEACELWLRRLVHDKFLPEFGAAYLDTAQLTGQAIFNTHTRKHSASRIAANPKRYQRPIDTLELDQLASVICKKDVYSQYFTPAFAHGFPLANNHLRLVLSRLVPVRNSLSHANPITLHDAERALCYSSDIIASLVVYYESLGMAQDFNAPLVTKITDSLGHVIYPKGSQEQLHFETGPVLRPGDALRIEVEVDAHFPPSDYEVSWRVATPPTSTTTRGSRFDLTLGLQHVAQEFIVVATVVSNKPWHRHSTFDAQHIVVYRVLPPP